MDLLTTVNNILNCELRNSNLKCCLVTKNKLPYKIDNTPAKSNILTDFISIFDIASNLTEKHLLDYAGIGISIQASEICAIDVDKCFSEPFNFDSIDERGLDIYNKFKDFAYIEFSFSGTGLRVLFKSDIIENYSDKYYIKNETNKVEYYQPTKSYRYVTITGRYLINNVIKYDKKLNDILQLFLEQYMLKPERKQYDVKTIVEETRTYEELMKLVKLHYFKDNLFQNLWFDKAPGSGSNESERDYHLVAYLFENITQDKDLIKQIFESSPFFKSKDWKHVNKWTYQNGRYYNYLYDTIRRNKL